MFRVLVATAVIALLAYQQPGGRPRARDLGIAPGAMTPGPLNAITDVAGVRVGQTTLHDGNVPATSRWPSAGTRRCA